MQRLSPIRRCPHVLQQTLPQVEWQHHHWSPRVTAAEILTVDEPDMWARIVEREYVHCQKEEVCSECGAVRHALSCVCEIDKGDECELRLRYLDRKSAS